MSADHIADLIQGLDPGAVVTKFVVIAEVIDTDGEQCVWMETNHDANPWDTLGLLAYAKAIETEAMRRAEDQ